MMVNSSKFVFHSPPPPPPHHHHHHHQQQQNDDEDDDDDLITRNNIEQLLGITIIDDDGPPLLSSTTNNNNNNIDKITLPKLKYGYRQIPLCWNELIHIIKVDKDLARLSRSIKQQKQYEIFRYYLNLYYKSIVDYVLITKFNIPKQYNNQTKLWQASTTTMDEDEDEKSTRKDVKMVLSPNDFPYSMEEGIVHYILWKLGCPSSSKIITKIDIDDAINELKKQLSPQDIIYWINPPHLKSLPEIDHVHFLCLLDEKKKKKEEREENQKMK